MLGTPIPSRDNYFAAVVTATLLVCAAAWVAGREWGWPTIEIATVLMLICVLGATLVYASRRRVAALEMAVARGNDHESNSCPRSVCEAATKVERYTFELDTQYDHARDELQRLRLLLDEAIAKLVASFASLHDLAMRQRSLVQPHFAPDSACVADGSSLADPRAMLADLVEQFDHQVHDVVTTLQFQDMATQLVDHASARIDRAQLLSGGLGAFFATLERGNEMPVPKRCESRADAASDHVDHVRRMARATPVAVARIAPGDVDLF